MIVDFVANERSIHGQFQSAGEFSKSVDVLMRIRDAIRRAGRNLFCHNSMSYAQVTADRSMRQVIEVLPLDQRRAWMNWITRGGPFWMDERSHGEDEWLETSNGIDVVGTAIGEAAYCRIHGIVRELVSIAPSEWLGSPVNVIWVMDYEKRIPVDVPNHWILDTVLKSLEHAPKPFDSWKSLEKCARQACDLLTFSEDAFAPLIGQPYSQGLAERVLSRLSVLNKLCSCKDESGARTDEGHELYTKYFTGDKGWFSDSSASEKQEFESELTFKHPRQPGQHLFCTWHGKVKTPQFRIHFAWPSAVDDATYVVYVGPKITKR